MRFYHPKAALQRDMQRKAEAAEHGFSTMQILSARY